MKKKLFILLVIIPVLTTVFPQGCGRNRETFTGKETLSLVELVKRGESDLFKVSSERYKTDTKELPIGVFDSGIGGLTVLAEILRLDSFNNITHEPGQDGRPDFERERFVYIGDQANMPYGAYPSEEKTDFLRELIIKDAVFLLGDRYWPSASHEIPRYDKPPVKAIVIACNTATAYGLEDVRTALSEWKLPVYLVGVVEAGAEGAVETLIKQKIQGAVAVMATEGTCASEGYLRALEKSSQKAGITSPTVIQQGCLGLAGAVEGDASYIVPPGKENTVEYRGPAVSNTAAPIDTALIARYSFDAGGLLGSPGSPVTWHLNSVENYIRYHTAALVDRYSRNTGAKPISAVILGCTHFPYYVDSISASFNRLRNYRLPDGSEPYKKILAEQLVFIDPAELTTEQLYKALADKMLLLRDDETSVIAVDEFYISVPNPSLAGVKLEQGGGFTYEYKYGRTPGNITLEYVKRVPMNMENLSAMVRESIRKSMPGVWEQLIAFNRESPRTRDLPDEMRIR